MKCPLFMRIKASSKKALFMGALFFLGLELMVREMKRTHPFYINLSSSMERGIYALRAGGEVKKGSRVLLTLPKELALGLPEYHWLKKNWPLLKKVEALAGDKVCWKKGKVFINGKSVGRTYRKDKEHLPLKKRKGCHVLKGKELFVLGMSKHSFDSRYLGVLLKKDILGEAKLVIPFF